MTMTAHREKHPIFAIPRYGCFHPHSIPPAEHSEDSRDDTIVFEMGAEVIVFFHRDELGVWDLARRMLRLVVEVDIPSSYEDEAGNAPSAQVLGDGSFSHSGTPGSLDGSGIVLEIARSLVLRKSDSGKCL